MMRSNRTSNRRGWGRRVAPLAAAAAVAVFLGGCESKVTLQNYQQLKPGMTITDVTAILGSGTEEEQSSGTSVDSYGLMSKSQGESTDKMYVWKDGNRKIIAVFAKGKLVQMSQEGLQ